MSADFGLVGLAVMGENLVLNIESRGYTCAVYNRTTKKVDDFVNGERGKGKKFIGTHSLKDLVGALKKPRYNHYITEVEIKFTRPQEGHADGEGW
jgi:6-phosphogluconate dehydrogenase